MTSLLNVIHPFLSLLLVGKTRVRDIDGFCGTIMYLGPVSSAKNEAEIYAGVAWDDPQRGKHDGSVICRKTGKLVRHFTCEGGSFVRLSKIDTGIPLNMSVIQSKYVELDAPLIAPNNILPHSVRTSSGREKQIEFHGELKVRDQQQVETLSRIALRNMGISRVDAGVSELKHIKELDLGGNLLCDWIALPKITRCFSNLTALSLASNRIGDLIGQPAMERSSKLCILNLHSCGIKSFTTIQRLNEVFPRLQELCVAGNDLSDLAASPNVSGFLFLRRLDVSACNLTTWDEHVQKLSRLSLVDTLLLNDNKVGAFPPDIANGSFGSLKNLNLTGMELHDWQGVQGLASLPHMRSLSLRSTQLTASMGPSEARFVIISRFPDLEMLNSSPISTKERIDAEKRYVSQVAHELLFANVHKTDEELWFTNYHPQYLRLETKYHQEASRNRQVVCGQPVYSYTLNVTIISMASDSCHMEALNRRLPSSLTIGRLKALCTRAFGLDFDLQALFYRTEVRNLLLLEITLFPV